MIWHIVRFDLGALDEATRQEIETALAALVSIEEVRWLRVGRDVDEPNVTGLLTAFDDYAGLEAYRVHPEHLPVVERIRSLKVPTVRLDVETDDDPAALP